MTRLRASEKGYTPVHADPEVDDVVPGTSHTDFDVREDELHEWSVRA